MKVMQTLYTTTTSENETKPGDAVKILQKYSLTKNIRDFSWYVSSNQKMNQGLKTIVIDASVKSILKYI